MGREGEGEEEGTREWEEKENKNYKEEKLGES